MQDLRYKADSRAVALWMENALPADKKLTPHILLEEFETLLVALFNAVEMSVGEATLMAVADRVLYNSSGHYPLLMKIHLLESRFDFSKLRDEATPKNVKDMTTAFHYLITELLFVIGKLSGGSLTPRLHGVLNSRATKQSALVGKKKKDET
jgi:hypothetical protein